jgi:hypothetical protein
MTFETVRQSVPASEPRHIRHSVANWLMGRSLRTRLSLLVALVVATGIAIESFLQVRVVERTLEQALVEEARSTAQTITGDLQTQRLDLADVADRLHDFIEANPAVRIITVVTIQGADVSVLASTSSQERADGWTWPERPSRRDAPRFNRQTR